MKKIIIILLVLLTCGCSKKLTCKYEEDYEDIQVSNKIVFDFKENTYEQKDIMVFNDEDSAIKYFNDVEEYVDEYNLILENNKIISELTGEIKLNANKEELKEQYESYNYECK